LAAGVKHYCLRDAELAAIRERMMQPISRGQQVATELWGYLTKVGPAPGQDFAAWSTRDLSADDVATAMTSPPRFPLPTFDELGD
jgi:hypothetical protein